MWSELTNSIEVTVGRAGDASERAQVLPGKAWQEACGANGRGGRAAARVRGRTRGCGREAGSGQERRGAAVAAAAAAAAKRPCCMVCGAGGGGGGSKAERGDGRETPHTHGTRWPERQQHPELSGVPSRPRDPLARAELRPGAAQARGSKAGTAEARPAARRGRISRQRRPGRPGPRRRKRRCGSGRGGSPGPRLLDPARAEARRGHRVRAISRFRQPRSDPVSGSPAPFIVLCPWEEKQNVLERASRRGRRAGPRWPALQLPHRRRRLAPRAGSASMPRGPRPGGAGVPAADLAVGGGGAASPPGSAPRGKGRRRVTAGGSPKGLREESPFCPGELF